MIKKGKPKCIRLQCIAINYPRSRRKVLTFSFSLNQLDLRQQHTLTRTVYIYTLAIDKFNGVRMCFWISVGTWTNVSRRLILCSFFIPVKPKDLKMGSGKRLGGKQFNFTLNFEEIYGTPKIKISIKLEHMKALYNSNSSLTRSGTIDGD